MPKPTATQVKIRSNYGRTPSARPAIVFVHGAGGTGSHWLGLYRSLAKSFDLALVDLPGHGESDGALPAEVAGYADWLAGVVKAEGLDPARTLIAGHSMGGAVAIEYALRYPCAGLVLVSTGARLRVAPAVIEFFRGAEPEDWAGAAAAMFYGAHASPEMLALARAELLKVPRTVYAHDFTICDRWDALDRVAGLRVPALVIGGTADTMTPLKYARFLAGKIAGARLKEIEGAGHMPMIEAADEVAAAISGFVNDLFPVRSADRSAVRAAAAPSPK